MPVRRGVGVGRRPYRAGDRRSRRVEPSNVVVGVQRDRRRRVVASIQRSAIAERPQAARRVAAQRPWRVAEARTLWSRRRRTAARRTPAAACRCRRRRDDVDAAGTSPGTAGDAGGHAPTARRSDAGATGSPQMLVLPGDAPRPRPRGASVVGRVRRRRARRRRPGRRRRRRSAPAPRATHSDAQIDGQRRERQQPDHRHATCTSTAPRSRRAGGRRGAQAHRVGWRGRCG